jgi:hypothetical protein
MHWQKAASSEGGQAGRNALQQEFPMLQSRWTKLFDRTSKAGRTPRHTVRLTLEALEERALLNAGALNPIVGIGSLAATGQVGAPNSTVRNCPTVQFGQASLSVPEVNGRTVTIPVTRSGSDLSAPPSVSVSVLGGSATQGKDFVLGTSTGQFGANQSQASVTLTLRNGGVRDGNETVALALTSPSGASLGSQATFTLTIDETNVPPPPPHRAPAAPKPPAHRPIVAELVPVRLGKRGSSWWKCCTRTTAP